MNAAVYEFSNGVRVHRSDLMDVQVQRYTAPGNPNLHEPVEEACMLQAFADRRAPGSVFLDIGAAVGYYAMLVKLRWPDSRVVAIDALPRHVAALRANLALNGLAHDAIEIAEEAVGVHEGVTEFADTGYGSGFATTFAPSRIAHVPKLRVPTRPLSRILDELPPVHLMKMDIQGAELEVLMAARDALTAGRVRQAIIGTHGLALHGGVAALLADCGFEILVDDPAPPMQPDGILMARWL